MASTSKEKDFYVVGIGASAGGLEALEDFFANVPDDTDMAYVVIQHLSPDFDTVMDQLLARKTRLPVVVIEDDMAVRPGSVYLLPPRKEVIVTGTRFMLADRADNESLSFPIDHFFRSLAQDAESHAIAVILSGTGTDGSRGVLDVHSLGGMVAVQSEESARFNGMPRSACSTGVVDMALSASELPAAIERYVTTREIPEPTRLTLDSDDQKHSPFFRILNRLNECYSLDFSYYKVSTINRRIERRLMLTETSDLEQYAARVCIDEKELERLYRDLLIGVTGFFRDTEMFTRLEIDVIPRMIEGLAPDEELRCWVAACATGEEAYSLAMLILEHLQEIGDTRPVRVFASDVHPASLDHASKGTYHVSALEGVPQDRIDRFFIERTDGYQVCPEIRKMLVFTSHNALRDAPFTKLDLVACRNMLIYLTSQAQKKVLSLFHFGLKRDGVLCLGMSESVGDMDDEFLPIDERLRIYRKHRDAKLKIESRSGVAKPEMFASRSGQQHSLQPPKSLFTAYDELLARYMPCGVLIDSNRELVHSFSGASRFFRIPDGRVSSDVLDLVAEHLRSPLAAAIRRVRRDEEPVAYNGIRDPSTDEETQLKVWPFESDELKDHLLVVFEQTQARRESLSLQEIDASDFSSDEFEALERDLQFTRDNLQSTIEELQSTNQELQSANEQLTSSNEELQSTNEELHSVNEELYTVNAEHQRKIDELTDLNNDMDNLLTSTHVHTIFLDRDLCIRRFTPGIADTFSLIPQDIGRRFDSFSNRIVHDNLIREIEDVLQSGRQIEQEVADVEGKLFLLRILPYLVRGEVDGAVVTLVDITSMKEALSTIEEMSEIVEHSDDAIYRLDQDGNIRTWNLGANKLYGYRNDEIVGKSVLIITPADRMSEPMSYLERAFDGHSIDHVETERKRRNGTIVQVSMTVSPIRGHSGQIEGVSVIARDITKQKQAEAEIRAAVQQRDQFLATLSHELRNPLSAILNATSLLQEEDLDADTSHDARDVVDNQLRHVSRLLDDLLDVARFTSGKLILQREVVDLAKTAENALECVEFQIEEAEQSLRFEKPKEPIYIEGDTGRLQQAQVNLLVNASKYSRPGGSILYRIQSQKGFALITVEDDGDGISEDLLPLIFEPFVQAEQSIERSQGGMGLGLPLVRMIATSHGGDVTAQSNGEFTGSRLTLRIPLTHKTPRCSENSSPSTVPGQRLLLIEDNDDIRKMLSRSLELRGFVMDTASNAFEGLEILKQGRPDIAIIDIGLPDINGFELARRIRELPHLKGILLIALTGYGRDDDRRQSQNAGFDLH
ncbi:MAG: chemotaxis protein CheB, partial [Planctomycetota bacterium]